MGDFFRDWRRKIGMVTLVLACVFAAGWIRSRPIQDTLTVETGRDATLKVVSVGEFLIVAKTTTLNTTGPNRVRWWKSHFVIKDGWESLIHDSMTQRVIRPFRLDRFEYQIGVTKYSAISFSLPYWSIVIPLILLSAYLLLVTPRKCQKICNTL